MAANVQPADDREFLTLPEAAYRLRCSVATIRHRLADGSLPKVQLVRRGIVLVPNAAVRRLAEAGVSDFVSRSNPRPKVLANPGVGRGPTPRWLGLGLTMGGQ